MKPQPGARCSQWLVSGLVNAETIKIDPLAEWSGGRLEEGKKKKERGKGGSNGRIKIQSVSLLLSRAMKTMKVLRLAERLPRPLLYCLFNAAHSVNHTSASWGLYL